MRSCVQDGLRLNRNNNNNNDIEAKVRRGEDDLALAAVVDGKSVVKKADAKRKKKKSMKLSRKKDKAIEEPRRSNLGGKKNKGEGERAVNWLVFSFLMCRR
jgi:hypothetical protein